VEDSDHLVVAQTLRAQALIDMGRFDQARRAAEEASAEAAGYAPAHHERGIALYRLGRFEEAAEAVATACQLEADDADGWHLLGRCRVWLEDLPAAREAFRRAAELDPEAYVVPVRIASAEFDRTAAEVFASIPAGFRRLLDNAIVIAQPLPDADDVEDGFDPDTLGVYEGATALHSGDMPERIVLYQRNHENVCGTLGRLREEIRRTILHEVGHHFGMEEDELPY
jgi:predicted Zn-dependent protease with MMP-like domain